MPTRAQALGTQPQKHCNIWDENERVREDGEMQKDALETRNHEGLIPWQFMSELKHDIQWGCDKFSSKLTHPSKHLKHISDGRRQGKGKRETQIYLPAWLSQFPTYLSPGSFLHPSSQDFTSSIRLDGNISGAISFSRDIQFDSGWTLACSLQDIHTVILKPLLWDYCHVIWDAVLLKNLLWPHSEVRLHLQMMEALELIGIFRSMEMFLCPFPDLFLKTILPRAIPLISCLVFYLWPALSTEFAASDSM